MESYINDRIVLIGTAHVSQESVDEVRSAIEKYKPDVVAVELCEKRYKTLIDKQQWENTPITSLLKGNKVYLMLAQTFLASIQRRIGREHGVEPGSEMIAAIEEARKYGIDVALVDRDITVTLKRAWHRMNLREKFRVVWEFMKAIFGYDESDDVDLNEIMKEDVISEMMKEFSGIAPNAADVLVYERDRYIAKRILDESKKGRVVAIVGAGHLNGIKREIDKREDLDELNLKDLEVLPRKRLSVGKIAAFSIPIIFTSVIIWLIVSRGEAAWSRIGDIFLVWFLVHGLLSAAGAAIARGHPLSWFTAFIAAPFTSLEPFFAPGWFAGLVEAKFRKPCIKDFQDLSRIESFKDFFNNKVIRLLMVVALANLGSIIGTVIALPWILSLGLSG
ncbi:MAG: TraB/GumN family protein [Candidatus Thermoplasmatota archaeon]